MVSTRASRFVTVLLLAGCGDSSSANSDSDAGSGTSSSTGECMSGHAGCPCSEGLCLAGLACVDDQCVAGGTTTDGPTGSASDSASTGGTPTTAGTTQDGTTGTVGTASTTGSDPSTSGDASTAVSASSSDGSSGSSTTGGGQCGDGVAGGDEACDGADLGGKTYQDFGFQYGQLGCTPGCEHDAAKCTDSAACGDGIIVQNVLCYKPAEQFASSIFITSVLLGDMNGDGHLDMVGGSATDGTRVRFGNGDGTFAAQEKQFLLPKVRVDHLLDLDNDGDLDLVGSQNPQNKIQILHGDGAGNLTPAAEYDTFSLVLTTAFADVDDDGWLDMGLCGRYDSNIVAFRRGQPGGLFGPIVSYEIGPMFGGSTCGFIDFDGDGALDLWTVAGASSAEFRVLYGDGDANFTLGPETIKFPGATFADVAHLDGDDYLDVVGFTYPMKDLAVRHGTASFLEDMLYKFVIGNFTPREGALGNFDGNGALDVVVRTDPWLEVFRGDGTGLFHDGVTLETGAFLRDAAVGDLNEDGIDDFLTVHANNAPDNAQKVILSDP